MPAPTAPTAPTGPTAHHRIESIAFTGGYLRDVRLDLADGLNVLIGSRGAGKTTVLELLRFALGTRFAHDSAEALAKHGSLVQGTLPLGRVVVRVRTQHGAGYEASRALGEAARVASEAGAPTAASLAGELFEVEMVAQNEMERMARSPAAQLALIDRFAAADVRRITGAIAEVERRLADNAVELASHDREVAAGDELVSELAAIEEALRGMAAAGGAGDDVTAAHEAKSARARERAALGFVEAELAETTAQVATAHEAASKRLAAAVPAELSSGPNGASFSAIDRALGELAGHLDQAAKQARARAKTAASAIAQARSKLDAAHGRADADYDALVARLDRDRTRAAERARLDARRSELGASARRLADRRRKRDAARAQRKELLDELARLRRERFACRRRVALEITERLQGDVRVSVTQAADIAAYHELLGELLRGTNVRPASFVGLIAERIRPDDLVAAALADDPAPIAALDPSKGGKVERAHRILVALRASDRLFELETVALDDAPLVELRTGDDQYQPSGSVSEGQRCTAILPILLLGSPTPLLIDQPEDVSARQTPS